MAKACCWGTSEQQGPSPEKSSEDEPLSQCASCTNMLAPVYSATHLHWFPMELKRAYSNDNCLLPMPLPWCYSAHVCWVFCVLSFFASDVASGAVVRVLRALQHVFATPLLGRSAFMVQEPCLHPCTPPHILNVCRRVGSWESGNIR